MFVDTIKSINTYEINFYNVLPIIGELKGIHLLCYDEVFSKEK
jgi:hypothetical protein